MSSSSSPSSPSFAGKVILITGAGSGIGQATALKLASLSASLSLTDINPTSLLSTASLCASQPGAAAGQPFTSAFNISDTGSSQQFIASTVSHYGKIDHVFNCAGINPTKFATEDVTDEYWDAMIATNLKGLFNMTRAAIPHLVSGSSFVNVSSISGTHAAAGFAVYCATKFGVIGFSQAIALELGPRGIRCNVIAPGYTDTPTNASVVAGPEAVEKNRLGVSLGRIGTPEEMGDVVAFLMSDGARYMNGAVVVVDGGVY